MIERTLLFHPWIGFTSSELIKNSTDGFNTILALILSNWSYCLDVMKHFFVHKFRRVCLYTSYTSRELLLVLFYILNITNGDDMNFLEKQDDAIRRVICKQFLLAESCRLHWCCRTTLRCVCHAVHAAWASWKLIISKRDDRWSVERVLIIDLLASWSRILALGKLSVPTSFVILFGLLAQVSPKRIIWHSNLLCYKI